MYKSKNLSSHVEFDERVPEDFYRSADKIISQWKRSETNLEKRLKKKYPKDDPEEPPKVTGTEEGGLSWKHNEYQDERNNSLIKIYRNVREKFESLLVMEEEAYTELLFRVDFAHRIYGTKCTDIDVGPDIYPGPINTEQVYSATAKTELDVYCKEHKHMKLVFPAALPLEKGDHVRAKIFVGVDVSKYFNIYPITFPDSKFLIVNPREMEPAFKIQKKVSGKLVSCDEVEN